MGYNLRMEGITFSIEEVVEYLERHFKYATHADKVRLAALLNMSYNASPVVDPGDFKVGSSVDILEECQQQMALVRMIRTQILTQGANANPKDLQSLVSTTTSLFAMLTKFQSEMINQDRIKSIESAVVAAIKNLEPEVQDRFYNELEELLGEDSRNKL